MAVNKKVVRIGIAAVALVAVAAFAGWWFFIRDTGKLVATLPSRSASGTTAAPSTQAPATTAAAGSTTVVPAPSSADPATTVTPATSAAPKAGASPLEGTWNVLPGDNVFVGYNVQEQFGGDTFKKTAHGTTPAVTGAIQVAGTTLTSGTFTADLTKLHSDSGRRDNNMQTRGLEISKFPTATFTLTTPVDLAPVPEAASPVERTITGTLTLHGVTKPISIPLKAQWSGDLIDVAANVPIVMGDYGITPPSVGGFVSVDDHGELVIQLTFKKAA